MKCAVSFEWAIDSFPITVAGDVNISPQTELIIKGEIAREN